MTRFLSSALRASEPYFRHGLRELEAANGNPSTDIRFTTEVMRYSRLKLIELGLDPKDTTPRELYAALQARVRADDQALTRYLQTHAATHISAEADPIAGMAWVIRQLPDSKHCFSVKNSAFKRLIKANPPKKAMKKLGYRSLESFLKQEIAASIMTAAWLVEGPAWQNKLLEQYKSLTPADFESRSIQILRPVNKKWRELIASSGADRRHNLLSFKELGALIFLPLPSHAPAGSVTVSFALALHNLNEIRAASTYLRVSQTRSDFGRAVQMIAHDEPRLSSRLLDQPVSWHLIQNYYSRLAGDVKAEVFEPYLEIKDMVWHPIEHTLSSLVPSFKFWRDSGHLGQLDQHRAVSFNLLDTALNYCNQLAYEKRITHYFENSLRHELLLKYLHHEPVERAILSELQPQVETESALA